MPEDQIIDEPLDEALSSRYLAYALSTITARALPDVRDGLKPVHRRLMYAMRQLRLDSSGRPKKCARVVGDVIGRLHPHGDKAVYDALVRLAQNFSLRHRLIDGQGNFGNVDGDKAAAMRYTESRLTPAAEALLDGLDENAVDFRPTYDDQETEPEVLPAGFPNLLVNGASGIAVGMATSVPPHNGAETIDACLLLLSDPNATLDDIMSVLPGPDFPTGGLIAESPETIGAAYESGKGALAVRARWHVEEIDGKRWQVAVTEIPFQIAKARLIEQLAKVIVERKTRIVSDVRDESTDTVRIVLVPKSPDVEPGAMMEALFSLTDLQTRFPVNMNVLDRGRPRVSGLIAILRAYLDHRREVILRRAECCLNRAEKRLAVVRALLIVYADMDEVIDLIRTRDDPKAALIERFSIDADQAEAILNMRLRALRAIEETAISREHKKLTTERARLKKLIGSSKRQWNEVARQLKRTRRLFDPDLNAEAARRTGFTAAIAQEAVHTPVESIRVVLSERGWIRAVRPSEPLETLKFKDGDALAFDLPCQSIDRIVLLASNGRAYGVDAGKCPRGRGQGEPVRLFADLAEDASVVALLLADETPRLLVSARGYGFVVDSAAMISHKRGGRSLMTPGPDDRLKLAPALSGDYSAIIGTHRKLLVFPSAMTPRREGGRGVRLMSVPPTEEIADVTTFDAAAGLTWTDAAGRNRTLADWRNRIGRRGGTGRALPRGFNANGRFYGDGK